MKKGASHVDWAISMGIFLVYTLLMFIFLKPASEPVYSGNTLLKTVEAGLLEDVTYKNKLVYLVINSPGLPEKKYSLRIKRASSYGLSEDLKDANTYEHATLVNDSLGIVPAEELKGQDVSFDFDNEYCWSNPCGSDQLDVLEIYTNLKSGENVFWFIQSDHEFFEHDNATITLDDLQCQDKVDCLVNYCSDPKDCPLSEYESNNFTYHFGVVESYSGIFCGKLKDLAQEEYEEIKKRWGIPEDKNFNITIELLT